MTAGVQFPISALDKTGRAFQSVKNRMGGLKKSLSGLKGAFGGLKGIIIGTFGGAALRAVAGFVDEIQKSSIRLGISTEALSEYGYVAELSGVSQETLTKGMTKLGINISNAGRGLKTQVDALQALGLNYEQLINLPIDRQFEIVADRIKGVKSQSDKLRIANDLLGRSGVELLTIFDESSDSIAEMRERARELGATISGETANSIAEMNDSWTEVKTALRGVGVAILDYFAPTLTALNHAIADVISFITKMVRVLTYSQGLIAEGYIKFSNFVGVIDDDVANEALQELSIKFNGVADSVSDTTDEISKLRAQYDEMGDSAVKATSHINRSVKDSTADIKKSSRDMKDILGGISDSGEKSADILKDAFDNALGGISGNFTSLRDVALNAVNSIQNSMLRMASTNFSDYLFGGSNRLPWQPTPFETITSGIKSLFSGMHADGGTLQPGQWGIAGEKGAEPIFAGNAPLTVFPHQSLQSQGNAAAGQPVQVVYNIDARGAYAGVEQRVIKAIQAVDKSVESRAVVAVANARRRNPALI